MPKKKKKPKPAAKKAPPKKAPAKKAVKAPAKKAPVKKAPVKKKSPAPAAIKKKSAASGKKSAKKKTASNSVVAAKAETFSLGRPLITGEEKLFLLFREDYHARQVFDFLRVETVKELEQFSPQEIVQRLSQPIRQTVEGIRRRLAEKNRCLAGDEDYAARYKEKI